jgi:hypothetical protein
MQPPPNLGPHQTPKTRPGLNTQCIKDIVTDFGLDGADIDWEPSGPNCVASGGTVSCPTDTEAINVATKLRQALPKGQYLLSTASFHVGCYGTGAFAASKPNSVVRGACPSCLPLGWRGHVCAEAPTRSKSGLCTHARAPVSTARTFPVKYNGRAL